MAKLVAKAVKAAAAVNTATNKATTKTVQNVSRRPKRIVNQQIGSASQFIWSFIITIVSLSLLYLVLSSAQQNPKRFTAMMDTIPDALRRFVTPFNEEQP